MEIITGVGIVFVTFIVGLVGYVFVEHKKCDSCKEQHYKELEEARKPLKIEITNVKDFFGDIK